MTDHDSHRPRLLVLDTAYSLRAVRSRGLETAVTARDLCGWFEHVWSVHPLVGADPTTGDEPVGAIDVTDLHDRHTVVEAHTGRYPWLRRVAPLNLVVAQVEILMRLVRLVRREHIDIVRAGDPYYLGLLGTVLARAARIPLVVRVSGNYDAIYATVGRLAYPRLFRRRSVEKRIDRFVLRRADLVVAPNRDNLAFAVANGADPARTDVFPYGNLIHPAHFTDPSTRARVDDELGIGGRPYVVYVSRLEPVKRPDDVVAVVDDLRRRGHDVGGVIVGEGSLRAELEADIDRRGLTGIVALPGNRDQEWLARAVAGAVAVAAPSAGRALVEAALSARPVVASDSDWHAELIEDGVTGFLVPLGRADLMADALARLLDDPAAADAMGRAAREATAELMSPRRLAEHERLAYCRVLQRRPGGAPTP